VYNNKRSWELLPLTFSLKLEATDFGWYFL